MTTIQLEISGPNGFSCISPDHPFGVKKHRYRYVATGGGYRHGNQDKYFPRNNNFTVGFRNVADHSSLSSEGPWTFATKVTTRKI